MILGHVDTVVGIAKQQVCQVTTKVKEVAKQNGLIDANA